MVSGESSMCVGPRNTALGVPETMSRTPGSSQWSTLPEVRSLDSCAREEQQAASRVTLDRSGHKCPYTSRSRPGGPQYGAPATELGHLSSPVAAQRGLWAVSQGHSWKSREQARRGPAGGPVPWCPLGTGRAQKGFSCGQKAEVARAQFPVTVWHGSSAPCQLQPGPTPPQCLWLLLPQHLPAIRWANWGNPRGRGSMGSNQDHPRLPWNPALVQFYL